MVHSAHRSALPALLVLVTATFALTACTTPEVIRETPQAGATATQTLVPVETTAAPTWTSVADTTVRRIERVALATDVSDDGTPQDERSVIPEEAELFYLCVQVSEVEQGSRFQAIWFEGEDIIGRSEKLALEDADEPVWIAMQYRPIAKLNPARDHAVELIVDDESIERFTFRVGIGNATDAIAAAAFTTGFDNLGKAINPQTRFHVDTPNYTLRVRVSNQVDPTGMIFTTLWYRGATQIAQRPPDGPSEDPRRVDFTLTPSSPLPPGDYRVALLLNGTEVRSIPFVLTDEVLPTATTAPTPTPIPPTPASATGEAEVVDVVIASRIDAESLEPLDGPLSDWEGTSGGVAPLWVALDVRDVRRADTIEIVVLQDDEFYGSVVLDETRLDTGWLAGRVELEIPVTDNETFRYLFSVRVNGELQQETTLDVSAS